MYHITNLEDCIKLHPEQIKAKQDELSQALIEIKKLISIPGIPDVHQQLHQLITAILNAQKIIDILMIRYHKIS